MNESLDLPSAYLGDLTTVVERYGVSREALLEGILEDAAVVDDASARISLALAGRLVDRAIELTGDSGLAVSMGLQMQVSSHGYLGFAAMTARTVREALELAVRFAPLRFPLLALSLREDGDEAVLVLEERGDFGPARDFILVMLAVGFTRMAQALLGKTVRGRAELRIDEPEYYERFQKLIPGEVHFGARENLLIFPGALLEEPILTANPGAMNLAREQCERELSLMSRSGTYTARVREAMTAEPSYPTLEEVAKRFGTSPRTLKRRLAEEEMTFSALLDELRRERALELLQEPERTLDEIAERLGYSDVANFSRAFRRWVGVAPGAYRRGVR